MAKRKEPDQTQSGITIDRICKISGLDGATIRKAASHGFIKKPQGGLYDSLPTISGLFRYLNSKLSRRGRPEASQALPVYNSQKACRIATGIPEDVQRACKGSGCEAFRFARVYLGELLPFLFKNELALRAGLNVIGGSETPQLNQELLPGLSGNHRSDLDKWKAARERRRYMEEEGKLVLRDEVRHGLQGAFSELFGILDRVFCNEMPPDLAGLDELAIRSRAKQAIEDAKEITRGRFAEIANEGKKQERKDEAQGIENSQAEIKPETTA